MTKVRRRDSRSTILGPCTSAGPAMEAAAAVLLVGRTLTRGARRVFAPHRCPGQSGPNRRSIPMVTLSFVSMKNTPSMRCYYASDYIPSSTAANDQGINLDCHDDATSLKNFFLIRKRSKKTFNFFEAYPALAKTTQTKRPTGKYWEQIMQQRTIFASAIPKLVSPRPLCKTPFYWSALNHQPLWRFGLMGDYAPTAMHAL